MQKTILWDVGGVILRTQDHQPRQKLASSFQLSEQQLAQIFFGDDDDLRVQKGFITAEQHFKNVAKKLNIKEANIPELKQQFFAGDSIDQELIDWIQNNRSKYQIAILSNAMFELRNELVEKYQIAQHFDQIFISAEMGLVKPNPQIFLKVINQLKQSPQNIYFIDDNTENIKAAQKIGMQTIHFNNPRQALKELEQKLKE
jgi:putative hydrolase of the HAD superfamily